MRYISYAYVESTPYAVLVVVSPSRRNYYHLLRTYVLYQDPLRPFLGRFFFLFPLGQQSFLFLKWFVCGNPFEFSNCQVLWEWLARLAPIYFLTSYSYATIVFVVRCTVLIIGWLLLQFPMVISLFLFLLPCSFLYLFSCSFLRWSLLSVSLFFVYTQLPCPVD